VALKVPVSGYRIEPGDLFVVVDMLEGFDNEVFKCTATSHGANWMVELEGEAILKCSIYRGAIPGNALFVSGDSMASVRWCHVDGTSTQEWHQNWLIDPFYSVGEIRASSYAKPGGVPTFVVGGNDFFFPVGMNACIATSHDGENWTTTYFSDTTYLVILNMVWDEADQAFYAHLDDFNPAHARCLRSPDGYTWTEHASTFWSHTEDGVTPDGKVGYDPDTGATIRPEDLDLSSIMYQVTCTAFADGIWMAGGKLNSSGHAATATSLDGGATWSLVSTGALEEGFNAHIWTMVAAPQSDFE
jgi:hypothetical protein